MFEMIGQAATKAKTAWLLLLDEVQYLKEADLSALIVAMHGASQDALPVLIIGAGLPQVAKLAGDAKSYAERMFLFPEIGALSKDAVREAVVKPLEKEDIQISREAIDTVVKNLYKAVQSCTKL